MSFSVHWYRSGLVLLALLALPVTGWAQPSDLRIESIVGNTVVLRWTPPPGPAPDSYVLEGGLNSGETLATIPTGSNNPIFQFTAPTGRYYVRIRAVTGGVKSAPTNENYIRVNYTGDPPTQPLNVSGLANGGTVYLSWRNSFGGGPIFGIGLYVNGALTPYLTLPITEHFTFTGVPTGTYSIHLRALGAGGIGGTASTPVTLTFPGGCIGPPDPPTRFLAYKTGMRLDVIWDPALTGPANANYVLDVTGTFTLSLPLTDRTIGGVVTPGTYTLSVRAVNPCGSSPSTPSQTLSVP